MPPPRAAVLLLAVLLIAATIMISLSSLTADTSVGKVVTTNEQNTISTTSGDDFSWDDDSEPPPAVDSSSNTSTPQTSPCPSIPPRTTNKKILSVEEFLKTGKNITGSSIPLLIHQIWIAKDESTYPIDVKESIDSWKEKNPTALHVVWGGKDVQDFVQLHFPAFAEKFASLPLPVLKADLFRYMVLAVYGGIYSDTDTRSLKPVINWAGGKTGVKAVIGVEVDALDIEDWAKYWARSFQWCQWTIASEPSHPILVGTVHKIISKVYLDGTTGWSDDLIGFVMELTGPGLWTDNVNAYLKSVGEDFHRFSKMDAHTYLDKVGLMLFTITGFSPGLGRQGSKDFNHPQAQVGHFFKGRWKEHAAGEDSEKR